MNNNDWLEIDVLEDYLDGKLDAKTMHRVERLSLEDPFVAEALAGLSQSPKRVQSLSLLQKQLQDRIAQKPIEQKRWQITSQRLSIAAAAAVLFVTVSLLFWMREKSNRDQLATNAPKRVEVAIAPQAAKVKAKTPIDQVVAGNSKKIVKKPITPIVTEDAISVPSAEKLGALSSSSMEVSKKKELTGSQTATVLRGRVSGITFTNDHNAFKGIVYDEKKIPIAGATVKVKSAPITTVTNEKGEFSLKLDSLIKNQKLSVAYLGYQPKEVNVTKGENLEIELKADNSALNEVVVIGYGSEAAKRAVSATSTSFIRPEPVGGWDKFQEYLINNNKLLVDKKPIGKYITVKFDLEKEGVPINISAFPTLKNAQPLSAAEEQEAIRLFKEGPKWVLPSNNTSGNTTVNIRF